MLSWRYALCFVALFVLAACGYDDRAIFVTNTSVGIDADAATQKVSLGYDRTEVFTGPVFQTGAIPPVVGQLDSNLAIFTPRIEQIYATGEAAKIVTGGVGYGGHDMIGNKRVMYFGTSSTTGFQVAFIDSFPRTLSFGYKRKEVSIIPLIPVKLANSPQPGNTEKTASSAGETEQQYKYGSVLARICVKSKLEDFRSTGTELRQFIATGEAAENLAKEGILKGHFRLSALGMEQQTDACIITLPPGTKKQ